VLRASLQATLKNRGVRRGYLPGWIRTNADGALEATPIATKGSGVAFSKANALLIAPEDRDVLAPGDTVRCYPLDSFFGKEDRWQTAKSPS